MSKANASCDCEIFYKGYFTKALVTINVARDKRDSLLHYLLDHPNVNSLYRVDFSHDFVVEVIFENRDKMQEFLDQTDVMFSLEQIKTFNVLQELKKESFMSVPLV